MTEPVAPSPVPAAAVKTSRIASIRGRIVKLASSAQARPFEVWLLRAVYAYLAVKLGIKLDHAA